MILPDFLRPGLRLVLCGTAPGTASARRGHYYSGPGNQFWPMLALTGLTPRRFRPDEDHLLPDLGIGLTDLAKTASGQDADIPREAWDPEGLIARIVAVQPMILAFTSLTAARLSLGVRDLRPGRLEEDARLAGITLWALPSPSGLARSHFDPAPWHDLARAVSAAKPQPRRPVS